MLPWDEGLLELEDREEPRLPGAELTDRPGARGKWASLLLRDVGCQRPTPVSSRALPMALWVLGLTSAPAPRPHLLRGAVCCVREGLAVGVTVATCIQVRALVTECEPEFRGNVKFKQNVVAK